MLYPSVHGQPQPRPQPRHPIRSNQPRNSVRSSRTAKTPCYTESRASDWRELIVITQVKASGVARASSRRMTRHPYHCSRATRPLHIPRSESRSITCGDAQRTLHTQFRGLERAMRSEGRKSISNPAGSFFTPTGCKRMLDLPNNPRVMPATPAFTAFDDPSIVVNGGVWRFDRSSKMRVDQQPRSHIHRPAMRSTIVISFRRGEEEEQYKRQYHGRKSRRTVVGRKTLDRDGLRRRGPSPSR